MPKAASTAYTYDSRGNIETLVQAKDTDDERTTSFTWHADRNLPLTITRPGASGAPVTNKFTYDRSGNLLKLQENFETPLVRTTRFTWNSHGQMTSIDGPRTDVADTASFAWLPASSGGFLSTVTNGKGHVMQFENYNAFGKPGKITDANNIVTIFTYDAMGRMTSRTTAGFTTAYAYDAVGRLKKVTLPGSREISYDYTPAGLLEKVSDDAGNYISYQYDAEGNRTQEGVYDTGGSLKRYAAFAYDAENRLEKITHPGNFYEQYEYDDNVSYSNFGGNHFFDRQSNLYVLKSTHGYC